MRAAARACDPFGLIVCSPGWLLSPIARTPRIQEGGPLRSTTVLQAVLPLAVGAMGLVGMQVQADATVNAERETQRGATTRFLTEKALEGELPDDPTDLVITVQGLADQLLSECSDSSPALPTTTRAPPTE